MASYDTIPTPAVEDGPKPKTSLKRVLAVSAIASFVLGALAATSLRLAPASAATQTALIDGGAGKQYIIDDCYGTQRCRGDQFSDECWYDLHVEYLKEDLSTGLYGGWYCVGTWWSGDSQIDKFRRVEWSDDGPGIVQFDPDCYHTSSDPKDWKTGCHPYDAADFSSTDCPAAYDQNYGQWRCFSEDDFVASSLSAWDLAYQTKRAAEAYYPDDYSMDLYGSNGYFNIDEDYANKHPNKKHQYFYWLLSSHPP